MSKSSNPGGGSGRAVDKGYLTDAILKIRMGRVGHYGRRKEVIKTVTTHRIEFVRSRLRALLPSARSGEREDELTEADIRAIWAYFDGHGLGSRVLEVNRVRDKDELLRALQRVHGAFRQMRAQDHASRTSGNGKKN